MNDFDSFAARLITLAAALAVVIWVVWELR
jgi:hypothetical protein